MKKIIYWWRTNYSSTPVFSFMCMFCRSLFVLLYFFFWSLCCLFFFDIRILNNPLLSSNSSSNFLIYYWLNRNEQLIGNLFKVFCLICQMKKQQSFVSLHIICEVIQQFLFSHYWEIMNSFCNHSSWTKWPLEKKNILKIRQHRSILPY